MNDLGGFISAMVWKSVRAFGHSSGATAIGSLACERPELIARAVLAEPVVFESPNAPELRTAATHSSSGRSNAAACSTASTRCTRTSSTSRPTTTPRAATCCAITASSGTRITPDGKRELKCTPEIEAQIYRSSRDFDGLGRILRADTPMLILFGEQRLAGPFAGGKIAAKLKQGRVVKIPDAGHFLPMEKPDLVAQMAVDFLSEK